MASSITIRLIPTKQCSYFWLAHKLILFRFSLQRERTSRAWERGNGCKVRQKQKGKSGSPTIHPSINFLYEIGNSYTMPNGLSNFCYCCQIRKETCFSRDVVNSYSDYVLQNSAWPQWHFFRLQCSGAQIRYFLGLGPVMEYSVLVSIR